MADLEVKVAFQEHLLAQLDGVVQELAEELRLARIEVQELREQVLSQVGDGTGRSIIDEVPPHY